MPYAIVRNKHIEKLEELIDAESETVKVPVRIEAFVKLRNCYDNVQQKVEKSSGKLQYGWAIIENELMCEAEHHTVWESPGGQLSSTMVNNTN